jgi:hypothetical protein
MIDEKSIEEMTKLAQEVRIKKINLHIVKLTEYPVFKKKVVVMDNCPCFQIKKGIIYRQGTSSIQGFSNIPWNPWNNEDEAWEVVDRLVERGRINLGYDEYNKSITYELTAGHHNNEDWFEFFFSANDPDGDIEAEGLTRAQAICNALYKLEVIEFENTTTKT